MLEDDPVDDVGEFELERESDEDEEGVRAWLLNGTDVFELSGCERVLLSELHKSA